MYAKIFGQIFDSSLAEDYRTRHIFMDLIVLADAKGVVDMTYEAIARRTNVPIRDIKVAIAKLSAPDRMSRMSQNEGCRLILLEEHRPWGWQIVNFEHYHRLKTLEEKREADRIRKANYRAEQKLRQNVPNVPKSPMSSQKVAYTDTDTDTDLNKDKDLRKDLRKEKEKEEEKEKILSPAAQANTEPPEVPADDDSIPY